MAVWWVLFSTPLSKFFGFFSVFEKFAGIFGPAIFAVVATVTGSSRGAILSVIFFFAAGGMVLGMVDVADGQRAARQADVAVMPAR